MSTTALNSKLPPFCLLEEPKLTFSPSKPDEVDVNPLRGLLNFGPYSKGSFASYSSSIRIATVGPAGAFRSRGNLMKTLFGSHRPTDRSEYVPEYPGFEKLFRVPLVSASRDAHIKWPEQIQELPGEGDPQSRLCTAIESALGRLDTVRGEFDVVLVHFPEAWDPITRSSGFNAHDALKAIGARYNIPTQVINDRVFGFSHKASLAWRLATALYVKATGTPWKLAPLEGVPADTAYIGLAYALRGKHQEAHYVTCCSQVFDMDGGGMQFVAYEARDPVADVNEARRNPFLSRDDMRAVLAKSLQLYQTRNGGRLPLRMVIHKTTAFKDGEIEGAFDALSGVKEIECVEINSSARWRGVWLVESTRGDRPSQPAMYPVPRGTMMPRSGSSALVWVAGNAPSASNTGDYYQGKKSIPKPLELIRHAGSGPLELMAHEALALTKMDWNNDALYDPVPVSIRYSQTLARTIANVPELPRSVYPYRLFM